MQITGVVFRMERFNANVFFQNSDSYIVGYPEF